MMADYTHLALDRDIPAPAGYYTPLKEVRLKYGGREVLYVVSGAVVDAACCGEADFTSALVPGYVLKWHSTKNSDGAPVSQVEPITDRTARDSIREIIRETENVPQIEFW